jgi:MHS family proline/betaine transporter-like MFS transporter
MIFMATSKNFFLENESVNCGEESWTRMRPPREELMPQQLENSSTMTSYSGDTYSTHSAVTHPSLGKAILAIFLGNALEVFDFTLFSFFAPVIGRLFFPAEQPFTALLLSMATYGVGFLARLPGGIVLGRLADRRGRKTAMMLAISLMGAGTALVGLMPTYAAIGVGAPLLLLAGRLLQGFSAGGEVGPSTAWLVEVASPRSRNLLGCLQIASQGAAVLIAALCGLAINRLLSPLELESWGWRLPFLVGLLIGPVGLMIRRSLPETHGSQARHSSESVGSSVSARIPWRALLVCICTIACGTATMHLAVLFMPTYLVHFVHLTPATAFLSTCVSTFTIMAATPLIAVLADRFRWSPKPLMMLSMLLIMGTAYPAFRLLSQAPSLHMAIAVAALFSFSFAMLCSVGMTLLSHQFPKDSRAFGVGTAYNVAVCIFGGFSQLIVTWLIGVSNDLAAPAWYLIVCGALSLVGCWRMRSN